ncbi:nicotinamide-nucleotide amidase [Ruminococcaceae bacterium YRB3002]|nr:nicotinamide-nucleotide amidase [Ruminococcaceae bacterium YRB3002]
MSDNTRMLASQIVRECSAGNIKIGFAESLTGGMISAEIVSVPGASACLEGSIVSYSNEIKMNILGVDEAVIRNYGAVSEQCAVQMASGAKQALDCDIAVSVTGIAGPAGGTDRKPVGTVYIGCAWDGGCTAEHFVFPGDRESIREQTVEEAFKMLLEHIS